MRLRKNSSPEKQALIEAVLPKQTLVDSIIIPGLKELVNDLLVTALRAEIEIYKAFPKTNGKLDTETFDPRNHKTCFMGQGFIVRSGGIKDADLDDYRKAVGTFHHKEWGGNATLLEIWGGDHFKKHTDMVKGVFEYCIGIRKTLPVLKFEVVPFFMNQETGITTPDEEDRLAAMEEYRINLNGMRAEYNLEPVDVVEGDYLEAFELQWDRRHKNKE